MNRKLLDPFAPEYPEAIEACLDDEYAVKCAFSHHGSLLATARSDGQCYIWDMDTLNVMRRLEHGETALTGISWSRSGRYILTFDEAGICIMWDLKTGERRAQVEFDSAIVSARIHPRNSAQFIVCPARETPCLITIHGEVGPPRIDPIRIAAENVDLKSKAAAGTCCCFGKKGNHVFFGTSKGAIHAIHVASQSVVCSIKLSSSTVNTISRNPRGTDIVANSSDRILRLCEVVLPDSTHTLTRPVVDVEPSIKVVSKITDSVNRVSWLQAVFSSSGDYIVAAVDHKAEHNMYVWDKATSSLVKMLTGPNELLEDCAVHPLRPIYASISTFGIIYLWTRVPQQNWNAFAPGFRELEENIDYVEPEDEFDRRVTTSAGMVVDCAEYRARRERRASDSSGEDDRDVFIDVTEDDPLFSDSDSDSEDEGFILPVVVEFDADALPPAVPPTADMQSTVEDDHAMDVDQGHVVEES